MTEGKGKIKRLIVGITGATGARYGIRILEILRADSGVETHLVISPAAQVTIAHETDKTVADVRGLADVVYEFDHIGAAIASGSYNVSGMLVAPCSIKTLSSIANSYASNLISRAADVQLKEGRPLLLLVSESPFHLGHLRLMTNVAESGAIIMPPIPKWYVRPDSVDDIVNNIVNLALRRIGFDMHSHDEWEGLHRL